MEILPWKACEKFMIFLKINWVVSVQLSNLRVPKIPHTNFASRTTQLFLAPAALGWSSNTNLSFDGVFFSIGEFFYL